MISPIIIGDLIEWKYLNPERVTGWQGDESRNFTLFSDRNDRGYIMLRVPLFGGEESERFLQELRRYKGNTKDYQKKGEGSVEVFHEQKRKVFLQVEPDQRFGECNISLLERTLNEALDSEKFRISISLPQGIY